jgi:hypothetical protein
MSKLKQLYSSQRRRKTASLFLWLESAGMTPGELLSVREVGRVPQQRW